MGNIWDQFDRQYDEKQLQKETQEAAQNTGFQNLPEGKYIVKCDKIEAKVNKKGNPMATFTFTVTEGKYKKRKIFANFVLNTGFGRYKCNEFLRSMDLDCVIGQGDMIFRNFSQYSQLLLDAAEESEEAGLRFELNVKQQANSDFMEYKILDVFEA